MNGVSAKLGGMKTHHWLWVLVGLEVAVLVFLRVGVFARYHGG